MCRPPIGAHQGISHPLAEAHIAVELSRLATVRSAELFDSGRKRRRGRQHREVRRLGSRAPQRLTRRSRLTVATAFPTSTACSELWFCHRLMRTAPVSREMVLNFVAQSSLGLPRSY